MNLFSSYVLLIILKTYWEDDPDAQDDNIFL